MCPKFSPVNFLTWIYASIKNGNRDTLAIVLSFLYKRSRLRIDFGQKPIGNLCRMEFIVFVAIMPTGNFLTAIVYIKVFMHSKEFTFNVPASRQLTRLRGTWPFVQENYFSASQQCLAELL